mgnify:CR=1 FL=1
MSTLRKRLIRLAYDNPEMRAPLTPLLRMSRSPQGQWEAKYGTLLDGKTRQQATRLVNKVMDRYTKGLFRDDFWKPIHDIRKAMEKLKVPFHLSVKNGGYKKDKEGNLISKQWEIEVPFMNNKNRPTCLFGVIVCSAAGSVDDPLSTYDVVAYVN